MREKGRWADVATVVVGLAVGLSWIVHGLYGFSGATFLLVGLAVIVMGVMSLTRPGALVTELAVTAAGVLLFVLPWVLGYAHVLPAAVTAWVGGVVIAALGVNGLVQARAARRRDPELAWGNHMNVVPE
ncbi:SPW repeat protein [Nocardiopsis sp. NPDC058789]|uniref:SPW repeat protein n=1 Tax=Nocardiopsis eucommiae TaxID=2831970 RepID=A0A975QL26_9ACTN|nr:SPW repeat protein [Nocardiopsis eucommiae]